jgi:hypothetical protein
MQDMQGARPTALNGDRRHPLRYMLSRLLVCFASLASARSAAMAAWLLRPLHDRGVP